MVKKPFHIMPQSTASLLATALIFTLLLCGCSGGGGGATVTPSLSSVAATSGLLKLGTVGTTTNLIATMDLRVNLPAGVTVDADPGSGEAASGAVTISGAAAEGGNSLVVAKYSPAAAGTPAMLHIVVISAAGLHPGEFVTIRFNLTAGAALPALNAFTMASFSAKGLDNSTLSGVTAAPLSVATAEKAAAVKQTQAQLVIPSDQNFLTLIVDTPINSSANQTIKGTMQPADTLTITVNGTAIVPAYNGGAWSALLSGLVEGANIIAVTEKDGAGSIVASIPATTIILDTHKPNLNVAAATYGTKYSHISIGGTVDDIPYHIVTLDVKCPTATVDMATAAVPNWSAMISNLSYGDNTCHVSATDLAGNEESTDVLIHYDNLVPDLDINVNNLVKYGTIQTVSGTVESGIKPVMTVNGGAYAGTITASGSNWSCQMDELVEGANIITVTATDSYGNVATRTATITTIIPNGSFSGLSQPRIEDALKALRIAIGFDPQTNADLVYGDLFDDGHIDVSDAILILKKVVGL